MTLPIRINYQTHTKPPRLIDSDHKGVAKGKSWGERDPSGEEVDITI